MLFIYKAIDTQGTIQNGSIDAINMDVAILSLQRRGLVISSINPADEDTSLFSKNISWLERVKIKDVVLLSRQMATLFEAQVSALRVFRLLAVETENPTLQRALASIADDLQGGTSISKALSKHPKVFSEFYVSMVRAGEESGKLDETFVYLADYLDRTYEVASKAKNALVYPTFVIITFVGVMTLMLTTVIPNLSQILIESGQEIPVYTKVVLGLSDILLQYGLFMLTVLIISGIALWRWAGTKSGTLALARVKISFPYIGNLYTKLYLSRIADNLHTMLASAIPIVRSLEITAAVVGNAVYEEILSNALESVKSGSSISDSLGKTKEIPGIMVQMMKVGEETGELGNILETLAKFYRREVTNAVDTLVGLIEPMLIVALGLGVGFLLTSVLIPIYNISAGQ